MSKNIFKHSVATACAVAVMMFATTENTFAQSNWSLESAVQRALDVAPQRHAAESEILARQGYRQQAGRWSNPVLEVGASNAMGLEDGQGGNDINQITLRQSLPISGRLSAQRRQADADIKQAEAGSAQQNLLLEYETSQTFHMLQLNLAHMQLAEEKLQRAEEFQHIGERREAAGDMSKLERLRLDMVRESARQQIAYTEGEYSESLADFQTRLAISDTEFVLPALEQLPPLPSLQELEAQLDSHPQLVAAQQGLASTEHGIDVSRANRLADPEIWVSRERDIIGNTREDTTAFGIAITIPLWDQNSGNVATARANRNKAQYELEGLRRQLASRLKLHHMHLSHLIEQAERFRTNALEPAETIFRLGSKGFAAGEVEILSIVDTLDTYFEARTRYLELIQQSWMEAAELRRVAGVSLLTSYSPALEGNTP